MKTARGNGKQVYEKIKEINEGGYGMIEKLKPCPFCGREASLWHSDWCESSIVGCDYCKIFFTDNCEENAIADWNRRSDL